MFSFQQQVTYERDKFISFAVAACHLRVDDESLLTFFFVYLGIEKEEHDFLDDPVMKSLREQRNKHLAELRWPHFRFVLLFCR